MCVRDKTHLQQQYKLREPLNRLHHQSIEGQTVFTGLLTMLYTNRISKAQELIMNKNIQYCSKVWDLDQQSLETYFCDLRNRTVQNWLTCNYCTTWIFWTFGMSHLEEVKETGFSGTCLPHHSHRQAEVIHIFTVSVQHHGLGKLQKSQKERWRHWYDSGNHDGFFMNYRGFSWCR